MVQNKEQTKKAYKVPAVDQAIRLMLYLADSKGEPKSLTEICQNVGIHRSKAFSILNTLAEYRFVKKLPNRKGYLLGPGLITVTGKVLAKLSLPRLLEPILHELAKKAGATVALGVISEDETFVVAQYEGAPGIGISAPIGHVNPITYGAHGKAIAALLSDEELEDLLKSPKLYFHGSPKKFDSSKLMREIAQIRRDGYALDIGEMMPGVNAVGAPVVDQNGKPIGFITVVGFFSEEEALKIGPLAVEAVNKISKEAGHMIFWQGANNRKQLLYD